MSEGTSKTHPILIVDDNEDDCEAVTRAFKRVSLSNPISLCTTGQAALDFLTREPKTDRPALIMLDLNMPGMDGLQLLQHIRHNKDLQQIPIVIWTTSSNGKDIDACYQMGANAYMQKPVVFEELVESVRQLKKYWLETALLPQDGE